MVRSCVVVAIMSKASKCLCLLCDSWGNLEFLQKISCAFTLPWWEPCLSTVATYSTQHSDRLESIQRRAILQSYAVALSIANCPRLDSRRESLSERTFGKICRPSSRLQHPIPVGTSRRADETRRALRNSNVLRTVSYRPCYLEITTTIFNIYRIYALL